jgi:hypothetical protein
MVKKHTHADDVAFSNEGEFKMVHNGKSVEFEKIEHAAPQGQAMVPTERAQATRELEMAAGAKRVEQARLQQANRPPVVRSEAELKAEGTTTPVFRHNSPHADRVVTSNNQPISQQLGTLLRNKVGSSHNAMMPPKQ